MDKFKSVRDFLKNSSSFQYLEQYSTDKRIAATSISGQNFTTLFRDFADDVLLEFELIIDPVYINLYTYGQIADSVGRMGVFLMAPRPTESQTTKILLRKLVSLRLLTNPEEIDAELKTFCFAIDVAMRYAEKLEAVNYLSKVDISMWNDVDLQFTDIEHLVERRAIAYVDWDHFIDTVASISEDDLSDDYKAEIIKILVACKEFERINDHLVIQEVIGSLLRLLEEMDGKPKAKPKDYNIN